MELVLDAVLLPAEPIAGRCAWLSKSLSEYGTDFTLNELDAVPHLSIYMGLFDPDAVRVIQELATGVTLTATTYREDLEQGMFEVGYETTPELVELQQRIVEGLNPLRRGLRTLDPVGRRIAEWLPTTSGELRDNVERFGYDEIGSHFRPHVTLTRFRRRDFRVDVDSLPPIGEFSGAFPRLALFEMGPHGTCTRRLA